MALEHQDERETVQAKRDDRGAPDGRAPDSPTDVSLGATLKRTGKEFSADNITDWAAALTYYSIQAVFPALIALVSIIGLMGGNLVQTLLDNVEKLAPGPAKDILTPAIENLASSKGAAGIAFVIGLVLALNSASSYVAAFTRASNAIYDVEEGRPIWKLKPQQIGIVVILIVMLVLVLVMVAVSGPLAKEVGKVVGVGDSAVKIWDFAKIPIVLLVVALMFGFLYKTAPNVKQPGAKFFTPGRLRGAVHLDRGVDPVRDLHREVRLAEQDLRVHGRRDRVPDLGLDNEPGDPVRSRVQLRAPAQPAARGRRAGAAGRAVPGAARHHQAGQEGREVAAVPSGGPVRQVAEAIGSSVDSAAGPPGR